MFIQVQRIVDRFIGAGLAIVMAPFVRRAPPTTHPRRICIVKLWAIGESILTLPMILELRKRFPQATIDVIARKRNAAVYEGQPFIDEVMTPTAAFNRFNAYDLCIDCEPYLNASALLAFYVAKHSIGFSHGLRALLYGSKVLYNDNQHVVSTYLDLLKPCTIDARTDRLVSLPFGTQEKRIVARFLRTHGLSRKFIVGVEAGAAESAACRMWAKEKFAALCDRLIDDGCVVVFVGAAHERSLNDDIIHMMRNGHAAVNSAGAFSLRSFFALAQRLDMMISNDTGSMHIAAAQGTPTIGLFCPNTPVRFAPYGKRNISIYKPVLDRPCINVHKAQIGTGCESHNHMSRISVDDVYEAYSHLRKRLR